MQPKTSYIEIPVEIIIQKIMLIRGQKVMLDRDLASMYGVETKRLKEQVKRNMDRFPEDFMFEMTPEEFKDWRSQFASSNSEKMGLRYKPLCFNKNGILMVSNVINSKRAIKVSIQIVRVFNKLNEIIRNQESFSSKFEELEEKYLKHDDKINDIFNILKQMLSKPEEPRKSIGFKIGGN